ncbi:myomesin 1a (skelemin) isoform X4 [Oncorhynchus mykiss]|uniref:myomesin 1a (skelemin) isoform X4 n=1 Tax=Oncorhynchus mykiss TaxID=8022 RepID=UPI001878D42F|nr:myomesin 1a (skelemin) isoform X4 [Oncorhynchus mykiss]
MSASFHVKQHHHHSDKKQQHESISHHSSRSSFSQLSYAAHKRIQHSTIGVQQSFVESEKRSEFIPSQLLPPRVKKYLAMDPDTNDVIGYIVPVFRTSHEFARGLVEVQEEVKEEGVGHVAMRNLFSLETSSMETITVEKKSRKRHIRESADRLELSKKVEERAEFRKKQNSDNLTHPPEFIVRPRGQTVWEGKTVKLHCTVSGWPKPRIAWYKNNVVIDEKAHPDKYTAESNYNMHSLEIKSCDFLDTAQYRVSALNIKGESSSVATVVIKRFQEGQKVGTLDAKPHGFCSEHGVTFETAIIDSFEVAFGREGETLSLGCTVIVYPTVKRYQPDVLWYRNGKALAESKWVHTHWSGEKATLTLIHLNKEDEGLYTLRVNTKSGFQSYSAYVFVRAGPSAPFTGMIKFTEEDATVGVVPGEPTDLVVTEATKNYVVLAWSPPAQRGHEGVVYLVEKCVAGSECWQRANTGMPVKSPRFALFDLAEGKSYSFRVRCCNSAGMSEASSATGDITVGDMLDLPAAPGPAVATRNTDTSVVVSWGASKDVKHLVGYYINYTVAGSDVWTPANNKPVKGTRFVCHGLNTGDSCVFRVKAVNAAGYSHSSLESEAVVVKAGIAIPGVPSGVHLMEAARDYMVLAWREPAVTGGADIRGYFVDYRTVKGGVEGQWHELNPKAVTCTSYKAENLKENLFYQFQVRAINMAGVSEASLPSAALECKEWTIAKPGAPHDLHVLEVRDSSLVLLWEPPTFDGRTPVNGFYVDIKEAVAGEDWKGVHEKATKLKYMKVNGLIAGRSYVFRVRAQNLAGVGKTSAVLGPVLALTMPGTHEIILDVDDDGVISMIFECSEMAEGSEFIWSKNYKTLTDTSRLTIVTEGGKSRAIFNAPSLEDLGIFSCEVTNTVGVSASYTLTEAGLKRLLDISHEHKFPIIPFKTQMAMELLEKGRVRFWTQVEKFTTGCHVDYVFNDAIVENGEKYQMNFDKNSGIIEMFMDSLAVTDEGTFTFNLVDGKAKGSTSLVLIGEEFRELQKKSEFEHAEWIRRQGPHFVDYLGFQVTPECNVLLKATIGNIRPETEIRWYKDGIEIEEDDADYKKIEMKDEVLIFNIGKLSKKDAGVYEVKLKDARGKDKSMFNLTEAGYQTVLNELFRVIANSSTEISVKSTEHGIVLYSLITYHMEDLQVGWLHKEAKIAHSDRVQCGVTGEQLWLKVNEPTEKDKGKYTINICDGKDGVKRFCDLSGQAWEEAFVEFQRLKAAAIAERNRARVVGGLPDVVTIQEGKSLNLTGNVWGDPAPEVTWMKNDRELVSDERYALKFEHGKFASITIAAVTTTDSGKYALLVKNKYGTEAGEFTVSVYIPEEEKKKE